MHRLSTAFILALLLAASAQAQTIVATVTEHGLAGKVMLRSTTRGLPEARFSHPNVALPPDSTKPFSALTYQVTTPSLLGLHHTVQYSGWRTLVNIPPQLEVQPSTTLQALGTRSWVPVAQITIWPWRNTDGRLEVADSVSVTITWDGTVDATPAPVITANRSWYVPTAPYVRLHTSTAGIGAMKLGDIIATEPRFKDVKAGELALFWKGAEQPLYIVGKGPEAAVEMGDTLLFMSRFAQGDTSYLSMEDSTAVMFLTTRSDGERKRLALADGISCKVDLNVVRLEERYELDTGYYHLGNAKDVDYSDFNSDLVYLEGFYWESLNTNAYERSTWRFPLTPAPEGSVSITTRYVASTDIPELSPDTRLDVSTNGGIPVARETDGYGAYTIVNTAQGNHVPSGMQTIKWYATGIDSLRGNRNYFSEILIDAIEVRADVIPVLEHGSARVHIPDRTVNTNISWFNTTQRGWWIDTTTQMLGRLTSERPHTIIRGGLAPVERGWATIPNDPLTWRVTAAFGDRFVGVDTLNGYALITWTLGEQEPSVATFSTESNLISRIAQAPSKQQVVICGTDAAPSNALKAVLQQRMLPVPSGRSWVVSGIVDEGGSANGADDRIASGATFLHDHNDGTGWAADAHVPVGPATTLYVSTTEALEWARVMPARFKNLTTDTTQADVVIITHATHRAQAERLAQHRRTHDGYTVAVVDVDAILEEFGNGAHQPEAIRAYLAWRYRHGVWPQFKTVVLFGNASWDIRLAVKGGNVQAARADQVPTYGRPSSDYYFSLLDDPNDRAVPEVIVGRIPALTADEGRIIVDKIIYNDTVTFQSWMRTWFFVGGGSADEGLCRIYEDMLNDPFNTGVTFTEPPLCIDTVTLCKSTAPPNAGFYLKQQIDLGVQWMNYIGHGATEQFDINGWEPSELSNAGRYGVLATYACQTGSFSNPSILCKNAQYLTVPDRGMVAALGGTGWQYVYIADFLHFRVHEVQRNGLRRLGEILYESKQPLAQPTSQASINAVMQFNLLGDPNSRLFIDTVPRVRLLATDIRITPQQGSSQITDRDSIVWVSIRITSMGTGTTTPFPVRIRYTYGNVTDSLDVMVDDGICQGSLVTVKLPVLNQPGDHQVMVIADPDGMIDTTQSDNRANTVFSVLPQSLLPIEPVMYEQVPPGVVHIRMLDPAYSDTTEVVHMAFCKEMSLSSESIIFQSGSDEIARDGSILDWDADLGPLGISGRVYVAGWTSNDSDTSAVLWVPVDLNVPEPARHRSDAVDLHPIGTEMVYSEEHHGWSLNSVMRNVHLRSNGMPLNDGRNNPPLEMAIGDVMYVKNEFYRGVNLVVVGQFDTVPRAIRRYDTWKDPLPVEAGHNGFSADAIKFLRDSVSARERVLFAVCTESFSGFEQDNNLDTFRLILKGYGSGYADSLSVNSSWVMIGQQGLTPGSAPEAWKGIPDSLVILDSLIPFYEQQGMLTSNLVGPGISWDSIVVDYDTLGTTAWVVGRLSNGVMYLIDTLQPGSNKLDASHVRDSTTHMRVEWAQAHVPAATTKSYVREARVYYQPANEIHMEVNAVTLDADEVLRGDTVLATAVVRNADRRFPSRSVSVFVGADSSNDAEFVTSLGVLQPDEHREVQRKVNTASLKTTSEVRAQVDPFQALTEFYRYNNHAVHVLSVREDTVPPTISVGADERVVHDGSYVPPAPLFEVRLFDNSKLSITDDRRLMVFMNGVRIKEGVVEDYVFLPTDSCRAISADTSLRAIMRFRFLMDVGQNNLFVRAQDATGNTLESEMALFLASTNEISNVVVYPNPTPGPCTFSVYVHAPTTTTSSRLRISDVQGRTVRLIESALPVAGSTIAWDGLTDQGNSVSTGMYLWRLELPRAEGGWGDGATGAFQVLR